MENNTTEENINSSRKDRIIGILSLILLILEAALTVLFIILILDFNVLPALYSVILTVVLAGICAALFFLRKKGNIRRIICLIASIVFCFILAVGSFYIIITSRTLSSITGEGYSIKIYKVAVMSSDPAETMSDTEGYTFATISSYEFEEFTEAMEMISEDTDGSILTEDFTSLDAMLNALYEGEVDGMIYESSFGGMFEDLEDTYYEDAKIIAEYSIKKAVSEQTGNAPGRSGADNTAESESTLEAETETASENAALAEAVQENVSIDPFIVLISGNDEYNEVSITGRSDVNMLAVVNFEKHQVLLVSIPRDYYVSFPGISGEERDKLTHSGIYGIEAQEAAIEELFGIHIDYFVRVNFTSVVNIIDAIGGLAFYNPYPFSTTYYDYYFAEGEVWCDGWQALQYARERKSLEGGDLARGQHQQIVIEAMINKLVSAASLTHYTALMDAIDDCAITDMPQDMIKEIVRLQLEKGGSWNILKVQATGQEMFQPSYASGGMILSVVMPYKESVEYISSAIDRVYSGEIIDDLQSDAPDPEKDTLTYLTEPVDVD